MKKNGMRFAIFVLLAALLLPGCPYYKPAFRGKVIDAETEEPIEGVVVLAEYSATEYTACCVIPLLAGTGTDHVGVRETPTDEDGMFRIPPYFTMTFPISSADDTDFVFFKPGYGKCDPSGFSRDGMEKFFSKDIGDIGDIEDYVVNEGMVMVPVTFGIVRMSRLKTWKERRDSASFIFHCNGGCPLLHEMLDKEKKWLYPE